MTLADHIAAGNALDDDVLGGDAEEAAEEVDPNAPTPPPSFGGQSLKDQLSAGKFGGKFEPGMGIQGLF